MRLLLVVFFISILIIGLTHGEPIPNKIESTPLSKEWLVATGTDSALWKITVKNGTEIMPNLQVDFNVIDPSYGYVNPTSGITDAQGSVTTTFYAKTKSGDAVIDTLIRYPYNGEILTKSFNFTLKIDHDTPYTISTLSYAPEATVGTLMPIQLQMKDQWGNFIDGRKNIEYVTFTLASLGDNSRFINGAEHTTSLIAPDNTINGLILVPLQLDTVPGDTIVWITPPNTIQNRSITIKRVANGIPASILARFDPTVTYIPADGESTILLRYTLYDEYGNVLNNKNINVSSSLGDWGPLLVTTQEGQATAIYGPKTDFVTTTIFAYAQENPAVNHTLDVEFYDPAPTNLMLTINPITMPSRDADPESFAYVSAYVMDKHGKPSPGQNVTFEISNVTYDDVCNVTAAPYLERTDKITNSAGVAEVQFFPGAFTTNITDPLYNDVATGRCTITATWNGQQKQVLPVWKNYPYLSVSTFISKKSVEVNDTVDVTLNVKGDGFALRPKAIDVILCTNRGGSMLGDMYETVEGGPEEDKMVYLHQVGGTLLAQLTSGYDRAGVVSFGDIVKEYPDKLPGNDTKKDDDAAYIASHYSRTDPYTYYSTFDQQLNANPLLVQNVIQNLTPFGNGSNPSQMCVPMRLGLYGAIDLLTQDSIYRDPNIPFRSRSVKAVVLLADQDWKEWGDPTAGGLDGYSVDVNQGYFESEKNPLNMPSSGTSQWTAFSRWQKSDNRQNLAYYAKVNDVKIFPIAYYKKKNNIPTSIDKVFTTLASTTGGTYYQADSRNALQTIFEDIAGKLRQEAGVNTTATLNFTKVTLNNITVPGNMAFDYVFEQNISTNVSFWNNVYNPERRGPFYEQITWNQTDDWYDDLKLNFNIGNMYLGDEWQATFRLIARMPGTISFFGNGSEITFSGGETITIPEAVVYNPPPAGFITQTEQLKITSFTVENLTDTFNAQYTVNYTGNKTVNVQFFYRRLGGITSGWRMFATSTGLAGERSMPKLLLSAGTYEFRILAYAQDSNKDEATCGPYTLTRQPFFIFLQ